MTKENIYYMDDNAFDRFYKPPRYQANGFVPAQLGSKAADLLTTVPDFAYLICKLMLDPDVPSSRKLDLGLALLYVLSPLDFVPDSFPLLGKIDGAGAVDVMLTLADGGEAVYQVDETVRDEGREEQTVLADKAPVLVQTRQPRFQGAVVVCEGADRAAVKLAVTEAVASLTGLGSGKIAVVKMKSSN